MEPNGRGGAPWSWRYRRARPDRGSRLLPGRAVRHPTPRHPQGERAVPGRRGARRAHATARPPSLGSLLHPAGSAEQQPARVRRLRRALGGPATAVAPGPSLRGMRLGAAPLARAAGRLDSWLGGPRRAGRHVENVCGDGGLSRPPLHARPARARSADSRDRARRRSRRPGGAPARYRAAGGAAPPGRWTPRWVRCSRGRSPGAAGSPDGAPRAPRS